MPRLTSSSFASAVPTLLAVLVALASIPLLVTTAVAQPASAAAPAAPPPSRTKAPPRLPPAPADQSRIPAGIDTGTPATSDTVPLGTPVPPTAGVDQRVLREESAAARAAARRKAEPVPPAASSAASAASAAASTAVTRPAPARKSR